MVLKKTLYSLTPEARKVTEHNHQQATYVGGGFNLIRASKKMLSAEDNVVNHYKSRSP